MKQTVLETLIRLNNEKIKNKIEPNHITWIELRKELGCLIKESIIELIKDGKIITGHTLNDRYLKPINDNSMKQSEKNSNHEIWYSCDCCSYQFDLRETSTCPNCKTHKSESYGI
jgi:uncharacterized paraquat-inducible protein A